MKPNTLILILLFPFIVLYAQSVPARRTPIERVQPNGDSLTVLLKGDEHRHQITTNDGWLLIETEQGYIYYAQNKNGQITSSHKIAHNPMQRSCCENKWLQRNGKQID